MQDYRGTEGNLLHILNLNTMWMWALDQFIYPPLHLSQCKSDDKRDKFCLNRKGSPAVQFTTCHFTNWPTLVPSTATDKMCDSQLSHYKYSPLYTHILPNSVCINDIILWNLITQTMKHHQLHLVHKLLSFEYWTKNIVGTQIL